MRQGIPVYTPSWISPLGDQTEEYDWGLITATPTQPYEDWGVNQYKRRDNTEGSRELGILTSRLQLRSDWWSTLSKQRSYILSWRIHLPVDTVGFTGIATFLLSEDLDIASAISYESSGITGIATYKGAFNFSGANWFSQAHNTQSSVRKVNLQSVVLVMSLLHHSYQKDQVHYSNLVVQSNPVQRHTCWRLLISFWCWSSICSTYHWCWYWNIQSR